MWRRMTPKESVRKSMCRWWSLGMAWTYATPVQWLWISKYPDSFYLHPGLVSALPHTTPHSSNVHTHSHTNMQLHTHKHATTHTHTHKHATTHTHSHKYATTHTHTQTCNYTHTHTHKHATTHTHTHTQTCNYTHTHTNMQLHTHSHKHATAHTHSHATAHTHTLTQHSHARTHQQTKCGVPVIPPAGVDDVPWSEVSLSVVVKESKNCKHTHTPQAVRSVLANHWCFKHFANDTVLLTNQLLFFQQQNSV